MDELYFFLEVLIGGLLSGTMYSLVALGFVLIYKASGIFNFAQGTMVLFAALTFVGVLELGAPALLAAVITLAVMVVLAFAVERLVFRHMVNQPQVILFMATIGLAYFLEGLGQTIWGTEVHVLDLGIPRPGPLARAGPGQPVRPDRRRCRRPPGGRTWRLLPHHHHGPSAPRSGG